MSCATCAACGTTSRCLERLGVTEDEITIVNHWNHAGTGYDNDAERELASAIYQRQREQRKTRHAKEKPPWNC